jgi:hypothetical protein
LKKYLLVGLLVSALGYASTASALTAMQAGIKGGINMANLSGSYPDGGGDLALDMKNGFMGGAFIGGGINGQFGMRLEALYVQKGAEGEFTAPDDDHPHDSTISLDYLEFPLLFTARFPAGEKFAFNVFGGPTFAFILSSELEDKSHGETEDLGDFVESFEFGAAIGGGIEYRLSAMSLLLDVRYDLGGSNAFKDPDGDFDVVNRGIGIMAGLAFPIGSK